MPVRRQSSLIACCLLLILATGVFAQQTDNSDTRILIDISGSMKENDPKNLRRSALRLIVGLMPPGNRAGVWTFAQYTNMLVPLGVINDSWKRRARTISENIRSPGQFTDIEDVLRRSTEDWENSSERYRRNVILLTDGMVDVSRSNAENAQSRQRILDELVPRIKAQGARIHTIALSERADHELMQALSKQTEGWYEQVNSADELQRVFLRMFEKVNKPDAVPLVNNTFKLDPSISEATLLVFNKDPSRPTEITTPSGKIFDATRLPENVDWHQDEGYDLVTIANPEEGEWRIEAAMDPDNRVMVVTDMKMVTSDIPNSMALGESIPVEVFFTENGEQVIKRDFLDVVQVTSSQIANGQQSEPRPLRDDGDPPDSEALDGRFTDNLGRGLSPGQVELVIEANGKTFVRERRQATRIISPVKLSVDDSADATAAVFLVYLYPEVVDVDTASLDAWLEDSQGKRTHVEFTKTPDGVFEGVADKSRLEGPQYPVINVTGKTLSGNNFSYQPEAAAINGLKQPEPAQTPEPEPQAVVEVAPQAEPQPEPQTPPEPPAEPVTGEEETSWVTVTLAVVGGNLLLALIGGGLWWFIRRQKSAEEDIDFLDEDEAESDATGNDADKADADDATMVVDKDSVEETIDISPGDKK